MGLGDAFFVGHYNPHGTGPLDVGPDSGKGSPGNTARTFFASDSKNLYYDDGVGWVTIASSSGNATSIQGVSVSTTVPTNNQVLVFNSVSNSYVPGTGGATINPTTSIITIGNGLGAVNQIVGPTDQNLVIQGNNSSQSQTLTFTVGGISLFGSNSISENIKDVNGVTTMGIRFSAGGLNPAIGSQAYFAPATGASSGGITLGTTVAGANATGFGGLCLAEVAAPPLAPAGFSNIYMDSTTHTALISQNGGAYAPLGASINPTTSIITIGAGLGAVSQIVGPSDQTFQIQSGANRNLTLSIPTNVLNNGGSISIQPSAILFDALVSTQHFTAEWSSTTVNAVNLGAFVSTANGVFGTTSSAWGYAFLNNIAVGGALPLAVPASRLDVQGSFGLLTVNTSGTVTLGDAETYIFDTSGGNGIGNLPDATTCSGRRYDVKKNGAANTLTLTPFGGQTIDRAANLAWAANLQSYCIQSDGANWWII